jgi:hypothetical protein
MSTNNITDGCTVSIMKRPEFEDVLKIGKWFFTGVKGLLRTPGIKIPS